MTAHQTDNQPIMIAHALGAIDGVPYTNSEAAFRQSVQNGFEFVEADLAITNDQEIVLYHHYEPQDASESGWRKKKAHQLSWEELSRKKYLNKYPVLDLDTFLTVVRESSHMKIVLDIKTRKKKRAWVARQPDEISYLKAFALKYQKKAKSRDSQAEPTRELTSGLSDRFYPHQQIIEQITMRCDSSMLDRLIPQVDRFSVNVVAELYDFPRKIWKPSGETMEQAFEYAANSGCKYMSLPSNKVSEADLQLGRKYGVEILIFGTNDSSIIDEWSRNGAAGFYVDSLPSVKTG